MGIKIYNIRRNLDLDLIERETTENVRFKASVFPPFSLQGFFHCRLNNNDDAFTIYNGNNTFEWIIIFEFVFSSYTFIYKNTLFV